MGGSSVLTKYGPVGSHGDPVYEVCCSKSGGPLIPKCANNVYIYIYIYRGVYGICIYVVYVYQSEGFPRTGYFIPAHVGAGAGQVWGVLPPALFQGRKSQEISSLDGTRHGVLV